MCEQHRLSSLFPFDDLAKLFLNLCLDVVREPPLIEKKEMETEDGQSNPK